MVLPATAIAPATRSTTRPKTRGFQAAAWIERHCVYSAARWLGQPFRLLEWQRRFLLRLFEVERDGLRRYRWALLGVPKKNGKTELAAALALYFLLGDDEPAPLVVCAAASDDQADLVFGAARRMAELSPTLSAVTERYEREIVVPSLPGAKLRRLSAAVGTNEGQNIHAVICDELHEWTGHKGEALWRVLTNASGARRQPMVLQITTAGYDLDSICGQEYQYGQRVAAGKIDDRRYLFEWHGAPDGADYRDPAVWRAANPSWGTIVEEPFFRDQLRKPEAVFRRYFLNQWTASEESWLPPGAWEACRVASVVIDPGLPIHVGIDAARTHDASAIVISQRQGDRLLQSARIWANPYPLGGAEHDAWRLDLATLENELLTLFERFPVAAAPGADGGPAPGPAFYFDPWRFDRSAELLAGRGLNMIEVPQTDARMGPACMAYYDLIAAGTIAHEDDPLFAAHIAAAIRKDVSDRAWRLTRRRSSGQHIDAAIAGAISAYHAQVTREPEPKAVPRFLAV